MGKKILILNGSFCEKPIIEKAKEMGFYVITIGNDPSLIGHKSADEYICCDYSDKDAISALVKENGIEGIVSCANDFGVITAAYVAEQMGWKGHDTYENALLLHHKDRFKTYCKEKNIPSPLSTGFDKEQDALNYVRGADTYPLIVKANDLTGGKGIRRVENDEEARAAIQNAFRMSREKKIVIEPFIEGEQYSYFVFLKDQRIVAETSCKCFSFVNPYLIQAEIFPAEDLVPYYKELEEIVLRMAEDRKLADGILCLQLIISKGKIYIFETMRRCFGNDCLSLISRSTGLSWETGYLQAALGQEVDFYRKQGKKELYCGHFGILSNRAGIVQGYSIPLEFEKHLYRRIEMLKPGDHLNRPESERIAYLYYQYDSYEELEAAVKGLKNLQVSVDRLYKVDRQAFEYLEAI